jgi:hypothetical protein
VQGEQDEGQRVEQERSDVAEQEPPVRMAALIPRITSTRVRSSVRARPGITAMEKP